MPDNPFFFEEDSPDGAFYGGNDWVLVMSTMSDADLFPDATHLLWLTEAYGDVEASRIITLPMICEQNSTLMCFS